MTEKSVFTGQDASTRDVASAGRDVNHREPCSDGARARADRLVGTAPPARHWFLLEQAGNWGAAAWEGLDLDVDAKEALEQVLEDANARLMLIRRPILDPHASTVDPRAGKVDRTATVEPRAGQVTASKTPRRWCLIQSRPGGEPRVVWGSALTTDDVLAAARLFAEPTANTPGVDPTPTARPESAGPEILLVCTHGRKDVCCAVRGRPVAAQAAKLWPEATWECTHTGGDRFAGNLILLPDGACYGGLDPADVASIVTAHVQGRVDPEHLRGPSGFSNRVQAAMVEAYARFAPLAFGAVRLVASSGMPDDWRVRLDVEGIGTVEVGGHTQTTAPEFLTCKAGDRKVMHLPVVDTVHVPREPASPGE